MINDKINGIEMILAESKMPSQNNYNSENSPNYLIVAGVATAVVLAYALGKFQKRREVNNKEREVYRDRKRIQSPRGW